MPRTAITPQQGLRAGGTITNEPANTEGNSFLPAQGRALTVRNGSGSTITVTVPTPGTIEGLAIPERTFTVAAGAVGVFAPGASAGIYEQTGGVIHVDYSAVASVTVYIVDHP